MREIYLATDENLVAIDQTKLPHFKYHDDDVAYDTNTNQDVIISRRFLVLSFLLSSSLSFLWGGFCRLYLEHAIKTNSPSQILTLANGGDINNNYVGSMISVFDREAVLETKTKTSRNNKVHTRNDTRRHHSTSHLLVEIENVNGAFIGDKNVMRLTVLRVLNQNRFDILSCHCHNDLKYRGGVFCLGLLRDGRISVTTSPDEGYLSIDYFTFSSSDAVVGLVPIIAKTFTFADTIERQQRRQQQLSWTRPQVFWSYSSRGRTLQNQKMYQFDVDNDDDATVTITSDNNDHPPNSEVYREALVQPGMFAHHNPRRVAVMANGDGEIICEVLKHSSVESVTVFGAVNDDDDESGAINSPSPSPTPFLSFDMESSSSCSDDPRVEIVLEDEAEWFTRQFSYPCHENATSLEMYYCVHNLTSYGQEILTIDEGMAFDVIILNSNLQSGKYFNRALFESLYGALLADGNLVLSFGRTPRLKDPDLLMRYGIISDVIEDLGFESMSLYEESHTGTPYPISFIVACKLYDCRKNWHANEAEIELSIHERIRGGTANEFGLSSSLASPAPSPIMAYFDAATMKKYQVPPRIWEDIFCHVHNMEECQTLRGFKNDLINVPADKFVVKTSSLGQAAGRGVFTTVDIPAGSLIMQEQALNKLHISRRTIDRFDDYIQMLGPDHRLNSLYYFMDGYGFEQLTIMEDDFFVDSCFLMFMNHGCNGTNNVHMLHGSSNPLDTSDPYFSEATLFSTDDTFSTGDGFYREPMGASSVENIVIDRHPMQYVTMDVASRDISAGEELFSNYLLYSNSDSVSIVEEARELRAQCMGLDVGMITTYDTFHL